MSSEYLARRSVLWIAVVSWCAITMATLGFVPPVVLSIRVPGMGNFSYYEILLVVTLLLSISGLLRGATLPRGGAVRTLSRLVALYILFEVCVVLPVAFQLGTSPMTLAIRIMGVRFSWLLLPIVVALCSEDRAGRLAGAAPIVAAYALALWGLYLLATGGGGFDVGPQGELRFRILYGAATLLFLWPFSLAVAGVPSSRGASLAMTAVSLFGLALTNHRSGVVAFGVVVAASLRLPKRPERLILWLVPTVLFVVILWLAFDTQLTRMFGYTAGSLFDFSRGTGANRIELWNQAWGTFRARPFNDIVWNLRYVPLESTIPPHNFTLEIATKEGVSGLAFYASVMMTVVVIAWRWFRIDSVARALSLYLIAFVVFSFGNANFYNSVSMPLLVGAVGALAARVDQLRAAECGQRSESG